MSRKKMLDRLRLTVQLGLLLCFGAAIYMDVADASEHRRFVENIVGLYALVGLTAAAVVLIVQLMELLFTRRACGK